MASSPSSSSQLMPGPQGKTPHRYQVEKGHKTESYITAVTGNPIPPAVKFVKERATLKEEDEVETKKESPSREVGALTLDELEQYKNDPFWRMLRLVLFLLFCLSWLLMFLAAIIIVLFSPGCSLKAVPSWWQTAVSYQLWTPSFRDSDGDGWGDLAGLGERLEQLRRTGIQVVWPMPLLQSNDFDLAVSDHYNVDARLGKLADLDALIAGVHQRSMRLVISLPISITSNDHEWFTRSARASIDENRNFSNFYHWRSKTAAENTAFMSEERDTGVYYFHHEGKPSWPVLNWQTAAVRSKMLDVLNYWIDRGVDGFYLWGVEYMARTADGADPDWPAIYKLLREVRDHVDTYKSESKMSTEKTIWLFASRDEAREGDKKTLSESGLDSVINYELANVQRGSKICHRNEDTVAGCVHEILSDVLLFHSLNPQVWPMWELGNANISRLASRVGSRARAELLTMLQLILPGTNSIYYGEEIGMRNLPNDTQVHRSRGSMQWDDSKNGGFSTSATPRIPTHSDYKNINWQRQYGEERSQLKTFIKLAKARQRDETLMVGRTFIGQRVGDGFTLSRFRYENNETTGQVYVVGLNLGMAPVELPLGDIPSSGKLTKCQVVVVSSACKDYAPRQTIQLQGTLRIGAEQGIVVRCTGH